ncbi:PIG-L family deacetylase [Actibacterium sp. 188UL27-1]|uniref:PIG-L family deacetylase n=1 Tax=Actibacterium sp. 188UL27-1 TaxID=2786961 RepID=UPI00195CAE4A|nr:PIG-L family deacetylase [Actibacterium sp. 188UL27-1]MBM7069811.1 PIG-L family deacetylase [Actibacterium sp. 188UL27-1]
MPTPDQTRIVADRARPRAMELWWALKPLTSVVRFMQSGAHPDDEHSGMLAALALRDGLNLSYACSTRGEGGQNDIGTESGPDLGALRTREMEQACDILGMRLYWHSQDPSDTINDFGFSKSGVETLGRWGHGRTLARFVQIVRTERPDILCPTFLDVPGQHGHHRAMTQAAHEVLQAAADPGFSSDLPPWQIKKLYLPAQSGAGQSYDDDEPPPPATLIIDGSGSDPMSGWSWNRIGQQSRAFHRSQGMGRWVASGDGANWPLHLAKTHLKCPDTVLWSGLPYGVGDLAEHPGTAPIADHLITAQNALNATIAAFPNFAKVADGAVTALHAIRAAMANCPAEVCSDIAHRLAAKEVQLGHVIRLALGVTARCRVAQTALRPGQHTALTVEIDPGAADKATVEYDLPDGWTIQGKHLHIADQATPTAPYPSFYDPAASRAPAMAVTVTKGTAKTAIRLPFESAPCILPSTTTWIDPDAVVINRSRPLPAIAVTLTDLHPDGATATLETPAGWHATTSAAKISVDPPALVEPGLYHLPVLMNGAAASTVRQIAHPHIQPTALSRPAQLRVGVLDAQVPDIRVGYVGAGNDRVGHWLTALGADLTDLTDADLTSDAALAQFDTIVIGIFAMRFRHSLFPAMPHLHEWTKAGGTLVTLYHRPWDNWDPDLVPPHRLEIGQPSLRWRVTDEAAEVRHLAPDHPVLTTPNTIRHQDWQGWVKERGLYFAKDWDPAYTPLIEMADPGEASHHGALLAADVGQGRHVHTSLILHHQMENLVPGAFRLMANLIARRT